LDAFKCKIKARVNQKLRIRCEHGSCICGVWGEKAVSDIGRIKSDLWKYPLPFDVEGTSCYAEGGLRKLVKLVNLVNLDKSMVKLYVQYICVVWA
jgi:hypothetical protein